MAVASARRNRASVETKVLLFAAVGCHGREWWPRAAVRASVLLFTAASAAGQSSVQDLASDLAAKLSSSAPRSAVAITLNDDDPALRNELSAALTARGFTIAEGQAGANAPIRVSCGDNLREQSCIAGIEGSGGRSAIVVTRARRPGERRAPDSIALELQPVAADREPILDVANPQSQLLVLNPSGVTVRSRADAPADRRGPVASARFPPRTFPRDLRGRIVATTSGFSALLPGLLCRGTITPLTIACSDGSESWPLDIANTGMPASRNYFTTPEGFGFYNVASIQTDQITRWIAADRAGSLVWLDQTRTMTRRIGTADDVVRLEATCGPGPFIVTTSKNSAGDRNEYLNLFRVVDEALIPVADRQVPGTITALWNATPRTATLVVRSADGTRYEAFDLSLSCLR
jgi:hypothetical protein